MTPEQFQTLLRRLDDAADENRQLVDFLGAKFGIIDRRFEKLEGRIGGLEGRSARVEVSLEELRGEVRVVAEGVRMNGERLDRHEGRLSHLEEQLGGIAVWVRAHS